MNSIGRRKSVVSETIRLPETRTTPDVSTVPRTAFDVEILRARIAAAATLRRRGFSSSDADDLVQEACLRAIERRETIDFTRALGAWLTRTALHIAIDRSRRSMHPPPDERTVLPSDLVAMEREDRQRISAALAELDRDDRQIVRAYYEDDEGLSAIAHRFGIGISNVKSRLFRLRKRLAERLREGRP